MQLFCKIFLIFHAFQHNKNFRNPHESFIIVRDKIQNKRFFSIILFFYVFPLKNFLNEVLTPSIIYICHYSITNMRLLLYFFHLSQTNFAKKYSSTINNFSQYGNHINLTSHVRESIMRLTFHPHTI